MPICLPPGSSHEQSCEALSIDKEPYLHSMHGLPGTVQNHRIYFHNSSLKLEVIIPILQTNMLREVKLLAQGHTANRTAKLELQLAISSETQHSGGLASEEDRP